MVDAVDDAAQAPPRSKAPTEPATSPRSQIHEVPVQSAFVEELRLPSREYGPHPEPERFASRHILNDGTMTQEAYEELTRKAAQSFVTWRENDDKQKLQNMKHIYGVSKNGKLKSRPVSLTMQQFHVALLQKELRRCVCFQMSMQLFVRMIPRWLHFLNQRSRRLRPPVDDLCHQYSSLMQSLQGLAHSQCNLHRLQLHDQLMLQV